MQLSLFETAVNLTEEYADRYSEGRRCRGLERMIQKHRISLNHASNLENLLMSTREVQPITRRHQ